MTGLPAGTGGSVQPAGRRGCLLGGRRAFTGGVFVLLVQSVMRRRRSDSGGDGGREPCFLCGVRGRRWRAG